MPDGVGLIDDFLREAMPAPGRPQTVLKLPVQDFPAGRALLALAPDARAEAAAEALVRLALTARQDLVKATEWAHRQILKLLAARLLRGKLPAGEESLVRLAEAAGQFKRYYLRHAPVTSLVRIFEEHAAANGMGAPLIAALAPFEAEMRATGDYEEQLGRLADLREGRRVWEEPLQIQPGGAWANALLAEIEPLSGPARAAWDALLNHCATATASAPSGKWLDRAAALIRAVGEESFAAGASRVLLQVGKPGTRPMVRRDVPDLTLIDPSQVDLLRGLVWACATQADDRLLAAVAAAGIACFQKITFVGPRDPKVGNACLQTLSLVPGRSAVTWLARVRLKIRHPSARKQLDKALERVARREGVSPEELEEISVPIDLDPKEIPAVLAAQRDRIERFFRGSRDWSLADWRERYLDHPLVGTLARRLLWWFRQKGEERSGIWHDGRMVDAAGEPFDPHPASRVALWHPLDVPADVPADIAAWRRRLIALEITQPFKQAHREIYRLTDAERETATCSNRFAGQILKQHQLAALCAERGWSYKLQGQWDSHNVPFLVLPDLDLRIELWVDPEEEEAVSGTGIYLYVTTGDLRISGERGESRLDRVPPRAFSELLRDVDLFVSVCNAANDPTWVDRERRRDPHQDRSGFAFGDLGPTAATRRDVLAALLPKLKIADRCTLGDRFLTVRGTLRTYKIHLGSGNILMEPNNQYLCIVPTGRRGPHALLPYEGDGMLDVILSKAFLLVEDAKIKDAVIVRQIWG